LGLVRVRVRRVRVRRVRVRSEVLERLALRVSAMLGGRDGRRRERAAHLG